VVQIWPGRFVCKQVTVCPSHIWTTLYYCSCECTTEFWNSFFSYGKFSAIFMVAQKKKERDCNMLFYTVAFSLVEKCLCLCTVDCTAGPIIQPTVWFCSFPSIRSFRGTEMNSQICAKVNNHFTAGITHLFVMKQYSNRDVKCHNKMRRGIQHKNICSKFDPILQYKLF
jgi:hypothetical protein